MPRPKRKKIKFDEQSVNDLLQEIYDDSHNIRAQIKRLFTKWETKVKEGGEIAALGDQIVKFIAAEAKNQDQKIMLLRYLKEVVFAKNTGVQAGNDEKEVTADDRNQLIDMVHKELEKKDKQR
jgi:membrane-bound lytic murein transglycosylase